MSNLYSRLNNEQRAAVDATLNGGPVLVLAGAGTGKTSVLIEAITEIIIEKKRAAEWQVLVLTFTNKAAKEIEDRFRAAAELSPTYQSDNKLSWGGTFHSVCLRILRRWWEAAGLRRDFLVFGEDEQKNILKSVITAMGMDTKDYKPSDWVEKISRYKDTDSMEKTGADFDRIYNAYNAEMERLGGIDFADIINKVIYLFGTNPEILQKYQNQFRYILVDEYQDTNAVQNQLLKMLYAGYGNICCVGDDDQSIYSWRGAQIKNILNFDKDFPGAKVFKLQENYRSTGNILGAANSLIKNNGQRLGKDLFSDLGDGEKVKLVEVMSYGDAARSEAIMIANYIEQSNTPLSNFAVLIRSGSLSRSIEEEFAKRKIPHRLIGAMKFYDRMEIRDCLAYVRLLCFPFDDLSLRRVISSPKRGIGDTTIKAVIDFAKANNISMFAAFDTFPFRAKQAAAAKEFTSLFKFDWASMSPADAVRELLDKSGYMNMWRESKDIDRDDRLRNIRDLIDNVISQFDSLPDFLEQAALMTADDERDIDSGACVSIMTIHAAKGLEFDTVFLPAWSDGIFPHRQSMDEGGLEEERRLAYVAITRAKRHCFIFFGPRAQFGEFYPDPSRFISEIDTRFIEVIGNNYDAPKKRPVIQKAPSVVGKLVSHAELGHGVVIEKDGDILTVAFGNKGIKKVSEKFLKF